MIERNFEFIRGIGPQYQQKLRQSGCYVWDDVFSRPKPIGISDHLWESIQTSITLAQNALKAKKISQLRSLFPNQAHWALIPYFLDDIAYLDIETTGLDPQRHQITTIAVFDGSKVYDFIEGENLAEFPAFIQKYRCLCTFYGKGFDVPFMEKQLKMSFNHLHFDVCFLFRKIGIKGGLKRIEKKFNISRGNLTGVDGAAAVILWKKYVKTKNRAYLDTLLAYNNEDVLNLPILLIEAYNRIAERKYLISSSLDIPQITTPNPYQPSHEVLDELQKFSSIYAD